MKKKLLSILFCISGLMTTCFPFPGLEGKAPRVEQVLPLQTLKPDASVEITFSHSMDRASLDGALRFSGEEGLIRGGIEWPSPEKLVFTPSGIEAPKEYLLNISTLARSAEGVPLAVSFSRTFLTGEDTGPPELLETRPDFSADGSIPAPLELSFTFSETIDRQSFYRAFSLNPDIDGSFTWGTEDREVIFTSPYQPSADTVFRLDLTRDCTDLGGLPLKEACTGFFTLAAPAEPLLERIVFHSDFGGDRTELVENAAVFSFDRDESIELFFDSPPVEGETEYYISFQPNLDFQTLVDENSGGITVMFEEAPVPRGEYLLTVWGSEVILRCDGPRSVVPELLGVAFCPDTAAESANFQRIYPNDMIFPEDSESACLEIAFSHSPEADLSPLHIMENLSLSFTNGSAFFSPLSLVIADTPVCGDLAGLDPETTVHYFFSVSPQGLPGLMNLELSSELEDSLGNRPEESIRVSYNL